MMVPDCSAWMLPSGSGPGRFSISMGDDAITTVTIKILLIRGGRAVSIRPGNISITTPASGTSVQVGAMFLVAGETEPGEFHNPYTGIDADLPPTSVTFRLDHGIQQLATPLAADWSGWEAHLQVTSPGLHTIVVVAHHAASPMADVWRATATITVNAVIPRLRIVGVEQTQAIQFFNFNGHGSGAGADNSVPLIAQKSTVLRVYIESTGGPPPPSSVSGELTTDGSTFLPSNSPIVPKPQTSIFRFAVNDTLNFWLSPALCSGTRSCTLRVFDPTRPGDPAYEWERTFSLTFASVPRVRVSGVLVHYTGLGLNITAPTDVDLVNTLSVVNRMYPISGFDYSGFTVINFAGNLSAGGGGGCGPAWIQLFNQLSMMRSGSQTNDVYVGLLPPGVPTGSVIGCGGGGVAIAFVSDGFTMAQEIGHAFGRQHAPCGNPPNVDPSYPTFDMFPSGSIGEFGLDTANFTVFNPHNTFDFMSWCRPVWVSPYTYMGLKNAIVTSVPSPQVERAEVRDVPRDYLYLIFRVHRDDRVELLIGFHLYGPAPGLDTGVLSSVWCDLIGPDGEIVASRRCHQDPHQSPDDPYMDFHETLPWDPAVKAIAFRREREVIYTYDVEEAPPSISIEAPKAIERRTGMVRVEWTAEVPPGTSVWYMLRYSNDDGESWRAVAAGLTELHYDVDLNLLPGGERCRLQVVASSGIRTAVADTLPFAVAVKPVQARILSPADGTVIGEGERLELRGIGFSPDFGTTTFEDMVWSSHRDGLLDVGYDTVVANLSPGRHRLELRVPDGLGGESIAKVAVEVRAKI